jgi:hypothetical protein
LCSVQLLHHMCPLGLSVRASYSGQHSRRGKARCAVQQGRG